jgi:LysR family hydrogen peroxide-inducible transcriptional activator
MNLSELRYIVALARERHFGRAARACFVSQPTLSVAVKKLEDELGVLLFERAAHDIRITDAGRRVIERAQAALEAIEAVRDAAREARDQLAAPLRIGAIYTIGPYLFPDLISNLNESTPEMPLIVEENFTSVLTERLKQGELDVIIVSEPFEEPGILTLPLYEEPFVVLLPAAHPLTARKTIRSADLEDESVLMLGAGHCFRDQVLEVCPACLPVKAGEAYQVEGGSLETIRHMVASGMGVTVLPCTAAGADRYSHRLLEIRRFAKPVPKREVVLAWRASFPRPKVIDALSDAFAKTGLGCVKVRQKRRAP